MPGIYKEGEYDVAGFAVGSVKKDSVIDGKNIKEGDSVLGLPSSGVHSNGFSLARKILEVCLPCWLVDLEYLPSIKSRSMLFGTIIES